MSKRRRKKPEPEAPPAARGDRGRLVVALVVFGVAFAVRVVHLVQIRRAPFFTLELGDAAAYDAWARRVAAGDWIGHDVFYQAPLYPYVLGVVYRLIGTSPLTIRLCQACLSAGSCALIADAGYQLFGQGAGLLAGLMLAVYPPAIFLDTLIQKSVLDLFFLNAAIWLLARLLTAPSRRMLWWLLGLAIGFLSLTRENAAVLVVPIVLWPWLQRQISVGERAVRSGLLLAGLAVVLAPVAARNWMVGHELVITTTQLGPNLYIGNNERADGTYRPLRPARQKPEFERKDATDIAEHALGRSLTPGEVSSYYTHLVVAFVGGHPASWLRLLGRKFRLVWNAVEISDTEDQYTYADWSWPVALGSVWHFGVLAPLAVVGVWVTAGRWRTLGLLYALAAVYVATVVLFYVFARYRFPIVPFLILFAAAGATHVAAYFRTHGVRQAIGCGAVVAIVAVFCNTPVIAVSQLEATTHYNFGVGLEARGDQEAALDEYRTAVRMDPGLAVAHNDLGLLLGSRGDLAEAGDELERAVELAPDAKTYNNLGVVRSRQGRAAEAIGAFERAIGLDPMYLEPHRNLGTLLASSGRFAEAADELRAAVRLAPARADLHNNLGIVLAQEGERSEAAAEFERALALDPNQPQTRRNLERVRGRQ